MAKDPLPEQRRQKFTSGTYRGQYSELNFDKTFSGKPLKSSFESSGVIGTAEVPALGRIDDGRGSPNR